MDTDFCVTRSKGGLVPPSRPTPSADLDLSFIDRLPVLRCNARTLHVFRHGPGAASVVREALSRALVHYYPLAGRLKEDSGELLRVACTGEGAWFVEACADCRLDGVGYFEDVTLIPFGKLLPHACSPQNEGFDPLVLMQLTQFTCDGFVMGLEFCHSICDGLGAAQFLNAVGEMARGLHHPTVPPLWCRDFLPPPLSPSPPPPPKEARANNSLPPPIPNYRLEQANIDIPLDHINHLKQEFQSLTGQTCSAFEITAATLWAYRTRAINLEDKDTQLKLVFFANCRLLMDPPLPQGFYGNCFFPVTITASSKALKCASNADVVKLIQEAKDRLGSEFGKWVKGELTVDPFAPPLDYTTLFVSEWGRLGFNQVDYGHGPPVHVVPIQGSAIIPVAIVGSLPLPNKGVRLLTWCVEKPHLQPFVQHMTNLI